VVFATSLRYDDGKTLNGTGTLASKSRLTTFQGERTLLECLSTDRKEDKKGSLASWAKEVREESVFRERFYLVVFQWKWIVSCKYG